MNINGFNITSYDLIDNIDGMIHTTNVLIYGALIDEYEERNNVDTLCNGHVHKIQEELDTLIEYFTGTEEYERCAELKKIRDSYDGVPQKIYKQ
jgi:UDP-2,3-diacylglucosamine pyrophosphatase LpxH